MLHPFQTGNGSGAEKSRVCPVPIPIQLRARAVRIEGAQFDQVCTWGCVDFAALDLFDDALLLPSISTFLSKNWKMSRQFIKFIASQSLDLKTEGLLSFGRWNDNGGGMPALLRVDTVHGVFSFNR